MIKKKVNGSEQLICWIRCLNTGIKPISRDFPSLLRFCFPLLRLLGNIIRSKQGNNVYGGLYLRFYELSIHLLVSSCRNQSIGCIWWVNYSLLISELYKRRLKEKTATNSPSLLEVTRDSRKSFHIQSQGSILVPSLALSTSWALYMRFDYPGQDRSHGYWKNKSLPW